MKSIANAFNDASGVREAGIFLSGNKYFFTQLDDVKDEKSLPGRSIPVLHAAKVISSCLDLTRPTADSVFCD